MRYLICLFVLITSNSLLSQRVIQSEEINIRSHIAFHLLGQIDDVILLYQDKGYEKEIVSFDKNLVKLSSRTPSFDKKRINVLDLSTKSDSTFHIIYAYKEKSTEFLKINSYNKSVELTDSILITTNESFQYFAPYFTTFSEDGSKVAIYKIYNNQEFRLILYDIANKETVIDKIYSVPGAFLEEDLMQVLMTDSGDFWLLLEHFNTRGRKDRHHVQILRVVPNNTDVDKFLVPLRDILTSDVYLSYDDISNRIGLFGLYSEKNHYESEGFFVLNEPINSLSNSNVEFFSFSNNTLSDLYGKDAKNKETVDNFVIADAIWRADGGVLLIMEMSYDYFRRPNYTGSSYESNDNFRVRSWTNHLNEDMLLYSIDPNAKPEWSKVIYKRQKSQDDQGIYSSFFTFRTPSRLRLIFNDEIKTNNTVSEYIFNSKGKIKRSSLLNTEYQNLKLRIKDALQISSTELIVPSQRSGYLSLVKIDYGFLN